ncbi:MAG: cbb3-type cytochrome oxidase assembly protein CcoS [Proteobacteria bacterium]|jgi:cbb3-type cytochrome oxidase maturation protein|nr:cbb3-type cytochrome oxidase assembly protein CcoS [Pseudomonadota bacterium]MCG6935268.1 cbb3-type cytochrome oxidase assembly protein CcoS [Pseudomonadota bacterium]
MSILFLLIPLAMVFLGIALWAFLWAVKSGQFEDMEGPAHRILMDDDDPRIPGRKPDKPDNKPGREPDA